MDTLQIPLPRHSIIRSNLFDSSSPKTSKNRSSHDYIDCFSPSNRQNFLMRKSILYPHGLITHAAPIEPITWNTHASHKKTYERTREEAEKLFDTIKDFPFIRMLCESSEEEGEFDLESILDLIMNMKVKKVESGDILYTQGDTCDSKLYLIFEGEVALMIKDVDHVTAKNLERFESEQKKRTIMRLGSFKKEKTQSREHSADDNGKSSGRNTPKLEVEDDGDHSEHEFGLLKSYMTSSFMTQTPKGGKVEVKNDDQDCSPKEGVDKDLARVSGVTRAFCKFKKVLKQRNQMMNSAKNFGVVRDKLEIGQYFGGALIADAKANDETAFVLKDGELLVIEHKDLQQLKANFAKKKIALKNFMLDSFPKLDLYQSEKIITGLLGTLEEKAFEVNAQILTEGQPGEYFYLVQSGTCEVSKEFIIDEGHALDHVMSQSRSLLRVQPSTKKRVVLTSITKGAFFGDELVFQAQKYCFSVKVTSIKANIVAIKTKTFAARFPQIVFESLKSLYQSKSLHYLGIIKSLLLSVQYDNLEPDCEQAIMNAEDKKAALDGMNVKDLRSPIKLRTKKRLTASALYQSEGTGRRYTASSVPAEQRSLTLTPKAGGLPPLRDLKESRKSDFSLNYSPSIKDQSKKESQEKLKVFLDKTYQGEGQRGKSLEPSSRSYNKDSFSVNNDSGTEMYSPKMVLSKFAGGSIQTKEEDLEKMKDTLRARTSVLKTGTSRKEYISNVKNSHSKHRLTAIVGKNQEEDVKLEKHKSATRFTPTSLLENVKQNSETEKEKEMKKQYSVKRLPSQMRMYFELSKSASEKDPQESVYELPLLQIGQEQIKRLQQKFKSDVNSSFNEELSAGAMSSELRVSMPGSTLLKKDKEMSISSLSIVKNQSFSTPSKPFGKNINPMDVQLPRNLSTYNAEKKYLKLKDKIFAGMDNDDSEESVYMGPGTPVIIKRDLSVEMRKGYESENSEQVSRPNHKTYKKSKLSNVETPPKGSDDVVEEDDDKQNEKGKKNGGISWQGNQSIMLNKKGKVHKQLTKKGELKKLCPYLPDLALDVNNSLVSNKAV